MTALPERSAVKHFAVVTAALMLSMVRLTGAPPQAAPDPEDVAEGMRIYRTKADCQTCHGWAADGKKMDTQMPDGANLRTTRLNRAAVIYAIRCGRPGRGMPAFDKQAYVDAARCNGTTLADLKKNDLALHDPAAALQPREMEMIADFLFAKVIGKGPMDRAACIEYWGEEIDACKELK